MKNVWIYLMLGGAWAFLSYASAVWAGKDDRNAEKADVFASPSRTPRRLEELPESSKSRAEISHESKEERSILLSNLVQPDKSALLVGVKKNALLPWYGKHLAVKIFCLTSGVALLGAAPFLALSMVCSAVCAPQLLVCLNGFSANQTHDYCPENQTALLNKTIPSLVKPAPSSLFFPRTVVEGSPRFIYTFYGVRLRKPMQRETTTLPFPLPTQFYVDYVLINGKVRKVKIKDPNAPCRFPCLRETPSNFIRYPWWR